MENKPPRKEQKSKLDQVRDRLYNEPEFETSDDRSIIHGHHYNLRHDWEHEHKNTDVLKKKKKHSSFFKKLFFLSLFVLVGALAYAGFTFYSGKAGPVISINNVSFEILGKTFVDGGEDFDVTVRVVNNNPVPLELVDLTVMYPQGAVSDAGNMKRIQESVQDIPAGGTFSKDFTIQLFGREGDLRMVQSELEYHFADSNQSAQQDASLDVTLQSTPITILVDGAATVVRGQETPITVTLRSNILQPIENILLEMDYPSGFEYVSSSQEPALNDNIWAIDMLEPGKDLTIEVNGKMNVPKGEERNTRIKVGLRDPANVVRIGTLFGQENHLVRIGDPFLAARLTLSGSSESVVAINNEQSVSGLIEWVNILDEPLTNIEIGLKLSGNIYDKNRVDVRKGFFDSNIDTIRWDQSNIEEFSSVEPGSRGTVEFSLTPRSVIQGTTNIIDEPSLNLVMSVAGIDSSGQRRQIDVVQDKKLIINTSIGLAGQTLHYSGAFTNSGPMPPRAEQETTYTLVFTATNTANDLQDVQLSTKLPGYVTWKNAISPSNANVEYNSVTRELRWNVGDVMRGAGYTADAKTLQIQVGIRPSTSQVGEAPALTDPLVVTGTDVFTGKILRTQRSALRTKLLNDTSSIGASGKVEG